jgi:hypothetical protein
VTRTSTVPADSVGAVAVIDPSLFTVNDVAAVAPNATRNAPVNPEPLIVTLVPPDAGPDAGLTPDTTGAATNVKWSLALVAEVPPPVVTRTSTVPADSVGAVAVIDPSLFTVNDVAAVAPNATADAPVNPEPLIVTLVPPDAGPDAGLTPDTTGAGSVVVVDVERVVEVVAHTSGGRHVGYELVVGPPVPTTVAEIPSVCGMSCGSRQDVAASPRAEVVAVVVMIGV